MINQIVKQFNIPTSCKIDKKLYKKQFIENFKLKSDEKRAIKEDVESIELLYLLNTQNINIEPCTNDEVDYSEVAYIYLRLSNDKHYKKLAHIVQYIPYMVVLLISYEDRFCINISTKRINQNDKTKLITDEEYFTNWIDINNPNKKEKEFLKSLQLQNQSFVNFKSFYNDLLQKVVALKLSKHTTSLITPKREKQRDFG
jgi:hypothetical protein